MSNKKWNIVTFVKQIISIPPAVLRTYKEINFHPFRFYSQDSLDWNKKYFFTSLAAIAFLVSYTLPVEEFSESGLFLGIFEILMGKIKEIISKGAVLYLSLLFLLIDLVIIVSFCLFKKTCRIKNCMKIVLYSLGTVYLTVNFILIFEHFAVIPFEQDSILTTWKTNLTNAESSEIPDEECIYYRVWQSETAKLPFLEKYQQYAESGLKEGVRFLCAISSFQHALIMGLIFYSLLYPLFGFAVYYFRKPRKCS